MGYGAILFAIALVAATRLPRAVVAAGPASQRQRLELSSSGLQLAAVAMLLLRCCVGFVLFHLAFSFRTQDAGTLWFGLAVGLSSLGAMAGNALGPRLRSSLHEDNMIVVALVLPTVVGIGGAIIGGKLAGVVLAVVVNFGAALPPGVREHRAARGAERQPRPGVRPFRDALPARLGGRRNGAGGDRDPRIVGIPAGRVDDCGRVVNYSAARGRLRRLPIRGQRVIRRRAGIAVWGGAAAPAPPINRR